MEAKVAQLNQSDQVQRLEKTVERLERVVTIGQMLNSTLDLAQLLETIIQTAADLLSTQAASILLMDERTGELFFAASTGSSREELREIKVPLDGSIAGAIFSTGEPIVVGDVSGDARHYTGVDQIITRCPTAGPHTLYRRFGGPQQARWRAV
jgi:GAF domain-containing protein